MAKHSGSVAACFLLVSTGDDIWLPGFVMVILTSLPACVPVQLPGGCCYESGPRRPADKRPHVLRAGPGQAEALRLPAAGPPQPAQQEGAAPDDDATGSRQPLVLH